MIKPQLQKHFGILQYSTVICIKPSPTHRGITVACAAFYYIPCERTSKTSAALPIYAKVLLDYLRLA